jgi:hypothetical protein
MLSCSSLIDLAWHFWHVLTVATNVRSIHLATKAADAARTEWTCRACPPSISQSASICNKTNGPLKKCDSAWNLDSAQTLRTGRTYGDTCQNAPKMQIFTKSNAETIRDLEEMWKKLWKSEKKNRKSRKSRKSEQKWWRFESGRSAKLVA